MELTNKQVGRNLQKFRMMRDMKASEIAEKIGMKEAAYSKYERGETKMTIDLVQKVATALKVDPIAILSAAPDNFIETISNSNNSNSPGIGIGNENDIENKFDIAGDYNTIDKQQQEHILELIKNQNELTKMLIELLGKK
jgi:transcriptional regulator with XRE-family HTH domain